MTNSVRIAASLDDRVSSGLDRIRGKMDTIGGQGTAAVALGSLASAGLQAGLGLVDQALSGVVDQAMQSVEAASSLNEAVSRSQAVFGDLSGDMERWADTASESFGQSQRSALEAAGTYGNLFQAFGIGQRQAADMSKTLVELASDLASFNNTSVDDALLALRSGLSGETEPLKRFGVAINDARLKEEALRLGLIKTTTGVLPQAIKTQAAYALILRDTTLAQGDFDRTSDGLANTQKSLAAAVEDAQAEIGEKLLPVMLSLANFAKDDLVPAIVGVSDAIDKVGQGGRDNSDPLVNLGNIISDLGQRGERSRTFIGALDEGLSDLLDNAGDYLTFWDTYQSVADERTAAAAATVRERMTDLANFPGRLKDDFRASSDDFAQELPDALDAASSKATAIAARTPQDIADALRDKRTAWQKAVDQLGSDLENRMSTTTEIAKLKAELVGDNLRSGLRSRDPVVRAQAEATKKIIVDRLNELARQATSDGRAAAHNYAAGLSSGSGRIYTAAALIAKQAALNLRLQSPAKEGPLSEGGGPEGWGERLGILYAKGMRKTMPDVGAMLSAATVPNIQDLLASTVPMPTSFASAPLSAASELAAARSSQPVVIQLKADGRVLAELVDEHLYYDLQRAAPTSLRS
jgi:hypothetical protein